MFVSGILRRSATAAIAVRAYEEGLTKKEKKSPNFVEYVLNFWDFDNSFYVNLKNKTKKGSIERDHCLNMLGTFKKGELVELLGLPENIEPDLVVAFGKPGEEIVLTDVGEDGDTGYYRDADGKTHYVPKRKLEDLLI